MAAVVAIVVIVVIAAAIGAMVESEAPGSAYK
jgi:hypothetical protein